MKRNRQRIAEAIIRDPEQHTRFDERGAVHSIQAADLSLPAAELDAIWTPEHLERLARTYWKYLSRVSLGLFRVAYTPSERAVVLIRRPFVLLRFYAPEYSIGAERGIVRWRIRDGLLVAQEGKGYGFLEIDVRRLPSVDPACGQVHVEVEVASFYPAIAFRLARWFYANTQSRIHVLVTHGFLRSLAKRDLERSAVGRFALGTAPNGATAPEPTTVGDTPWPAVLGLAAGTVALLALARSRRG